VALGLRTTRGWFVAALLVCLWAVPCQPQNGPPAEYAVKAAFLFNFA
jgi:hypothetical protein